MDSSGLQYGGSDLADECTELIGDRHLSLDVECGNWAPAGKPADEIGCGTGQYGTGATGRTECPFVVIIRANDEPSSRQAVGLISHQQRDRLAEVLWSAMSETIGCCEVVMVHPHLKQRGGSHRRRQKEARRALTEAADHRGIAGTAFSPNYPIGYLLSWVKLHAASGEHADAKCGRSCRSLGRYDMCSKVECSPIAARSWGLGTNGL